MRHDNVAGGKGMGDQEVVGTGQKGADGRWLIMLALGHWLTTLSGFAIALGSFKKKPVPRSRAQSRRVSSPTSISSPTFSLLKTVSAALLRTNQSQNAGQKSNP